MALVSGLISLSSIPFDKRLTDSFCYAVDTIQHGAAVSLTAIGRQMSLLTGTSEKHSIKRADRLIGNASLAQCSTIFYQQLNRYFRDQNSLLVIVDWAFFGNNKWAVIRASAPFDGRAFTLYEEVYEATGVNVHRHHVAFLKQLKEVLPEGCQPVICTDAGFKVPWFKEVEKNGWHWLGRIRGTVTCSLDDGENWQTPNMIYQQADGQPQALPDMLISKASRHQARTVLYHQKPEEEGEGEEDENTSDRKSLCANYQRYSKAYKDPWLLATNIPENEYSAQDIVNMYCRRMTIEESFRDSKNEYYGLGLSRNMSRSIPRLKVILLLLTVAQWELYIIGKASENKGLQRYFQANTVRERRVLSYCYLARRVMLSNRFSFTANEIAVALSELINATKISTNSGDP